MRVLIAFLVAGCASSPSGAVEIAPDLATGGAPEFATAADLSLPDLAVAFDFAAAADLVAVADIATAPDMANPPDLAAPFDLEVPPDLAPVHDIARVADLACWPPRTPCESVGSLCCAGSFCFARTCWFLDGGAFACARECLVVAAFPCRDDLDCFAGMCRGGICR